MQKANGKIFSALKMIEALYLDNKISYITYCATSNRLCENL